MLATTIEKKIGEFKFSLANPSLTDNEKNKITERIAHLEDLLTTPNPRRQKVSVDQELLAMAGIAVPAEKDKIKKVESFSNDAAMFFSRAQKTILALDPMIFASRTDYIDACRSIWALAMQNALKCAAYIDADSNFTLVNGGPFNK